MRTNTFSKSGVLHVSKFALTDPSGKETEIPVLDCLPPSFPKWGLKNVQQYGHMMLESTLTIHFIAPQAGKYRMKVYGGMPGNGPAGVNVYVNGQRQLRVINIAFKSRDNFNQEFDLGELALNTGENALSLDSGPIYAKWSDGTEALWETPSMGKGFKVTNGDVTYADDYDRMWPDTWSGQKKIYFYSWDGTARTWKLPQNWAAVKNGTLYPLTPDGRGKGIPLQVSDRSVTPKLLPQVPYILLPEGV